MKYLLLNEKNLTNQELVVVVTSKMKKYKIYQTNESSRYFSPLALPYKKC